MGFRIGVQTYEWLAYADRFGSTFSWKQVCYEAGQAGWVGVELTGGWFADLPSPEEVAEFCESAGVRIVAFTGGIGTDEDLETTRRKLEYLRTLGASALMLSPPGSAGVEPENRTAALDQFIERCKRLADYCDVWGIPAGLHNHLWTLCESEEEIRRFLDARPVGWCPDFGHAAAAGADVMSLLREYGDTIVHGHLKDAAVDEEGRWLRFCELGRGNVGLDWAVILRVLEEQGYGRWLVVEQDQTTITPMYDMAVNREYLASLGYEARIRG
jgi:inosose dehydratase